MGDGDRPTTRRGDGEERSPDGPPRTGTLPASPARETPVGHKRRTSPGPRPSRRSGGTGACPASTVVLRPLAAATVDRRTGDDVLRVAVPAEGRVVLRTRVTGVRSIHRSGYAVR